jgi:hypothetical protein
MQVVRLCSQRAQVRIAPSVEHLTLHYQVANIKVPGHEQLQKLHSQKQEKVCMHSSWPLLVASTAIKQSCLHTLSTFLEYAISIPHFLLLRLHCTIKFGFRLELMHVIDDGKMSTGGAFTGQ